MPQATYSAEKVQNLLNRHFAKNYTLPAPRPNCYRTGHFKMENQQQAHTRAMWSEHQNLLQCSKTYAAMWCSAPDALGYGMPFEVYHQHLLTAVAHWEKVRKSPK